MYQHLLIGLFHKDFSSFISLPMWGNAERVGVHQSSTLCRVFVPCWCHSGQTHRFRHCSSAAAGALEYPKKIPEMAIKRNFTLLY